MSLNRYHFPPCADPRAFHDDVRRNMPELLSIAGRAPTGEFSELREYREGDDFRIVATSRSIFSDPWVRMYSKVFMDNEGKIVDLVLLPSEDMNVGYYADVPIASAIRALMYSLEVVREMGFSVNVTYPPESISVTERGEDGFFRALLFLCKRRPLTPRPYTPRGRGAVVALRGAPAGIALSPPVPKLFISISTMRKDLLQEGEVVLWTGVNSLHNLVSALSRFLGDLT